MVLYWFENIIVGLLNVLRMAWIPTGDTPAAGIFQKLFTIFFFSVHYGIFTLVHGIFVFSLLGPGGLMTEAAGGGGTGRIVSSLPFVLHDLRWAIPALFLSHLVSFFVNFVGKREYEGRTV